MTANRDFSCKPRSSSPFINRACSHVINNSIHVTCNNVDDYMYVSLSFTKLAFIRDFISSDTSCEAICLLAFYQTIISTEGCLRCINHNKDYQAELPTASKNFLHLHFSPSQPKAFTNNPYSYV